MTTAASTRTRADRGAIVANGDARPGIGPDPDIAVASADDAPRRRLVWQTAAVFALLASASLFYELGDARSFASHEAYAVVPAREMLATGDWTVPRYGGLPRLRKPPLVYWIHAAVSGTLGRLDEWTARIPAAVCAVLLAGLMGIWAAKWYGRNAGWSAAFVQVTSAWVVIYGRKAEVDMVVWLLTTSALFLIASQPTDERPRPRFLRWTAIWVLLSVSWLGKFHYGPAMVLGPTVIYFLVQRRYRSLLDLANPAGLLVFAAAVVVWPWLVLQQLPGAWAIWEHETIGRATGALGSKSFWFYGPVVLVFTLPWTPFLLVAARRSWVRAWREGDARERFLWVWFLTQFAVVSLQPNKHSHYVCCALPACTLLVARRGAELLAQLCDGRKLVSRRTAIVLPLCGVAVGVAALWTAHLFRPRIVAPLAFAVATVIGGTFAALWSFARNRPRTASLWAAGTFVGSMLILHGWIVPLHDRLKATVRFAQQCRERVGEQTPVLVYRMGQDAIVYYLGRPVLRFESDRAFVDYLNKHHRVYVVTYAMWDWQMGRTSQWRVVQRMTVDERHPGSDDPPLVLLEVKSRAAVGIDRARHYAAAYCN